MTQLSVLFDDKPDNDNTPQRSFVDKVRPPPRPPSRNPERELVKLFEGLGYRHDKWRVFADFCEMTAAAWSNKVDAEHYQKREARYLEIEKTYTPAEMQSMYQALALLIMAQEEGMSDVLGRVFHALELHNKYAGQFFTPDALSQLMAAITVDGEAIQDEIARRGFITKMEPAVGSGAMVIALAKAMRDAGINYQEHLHVTAVDIDPKCVHMAYTQLSLLHIPAIVIHGDSMAVKEYDHWYTPAHVLGGWTERLRTARILDRMKELLTAAPPDPEATPPADHPAKVSDDEPDILLPFKPGPQMSLF